MRNSAVLLVEIWDLTSQESSSNFHYCIFDNNSKSKNNSFKL